MTATPQLLTRQTQQAQMGMRQIKENSMPTDVFEHRGVLNLNGLNAMGLYPVPFNAVVDLATA